VAKAAFLIALGKNGLKGRTSSDRDTPPGVINDPDHSVLIGSTVAECNINLSPFKQQIKKRIPIIEERSPSAALDGHKSAQG